MTAQIQEILVVDGRKKSMAFCPPLPVKHPRITEGKIGSATVLRSTACWRGYQGTWEIRDGRFYLIALRGRFALAGEEPLFADWFSGILRIPEGELLQYVHMGFGSVRERELHVKVENGIVTASRTIDNRGKQHDRWKLGLRNLPGSENRFPGDDEF